MHAAYSLYYLLFVIYYLLCRQVVPAYYLLQFTTLKRLVSIVTSCFFFLFRIKLTYIYSIIFYNHFVRCRVDGRSLHWCICPAVSEQQAGFTWNWSPVHQRHTTIHMLFKLNYQFSNKQIVKRSVSNLT